MKKLTSIALALATLLVTGPTFACASCGCTLNSDWGSQGLASSAGWSVDLRYDTLNQNQLRAGTGTLSNAQAAASTTNTGGQAELEKYTNSQYLTTTLDYNNGDTWGLSVSIPYIDRAHSTLGQGSDGSSADPSTGYDSHATGVGDLRVLGRFYGFTEAKNLGFQLGLKLPTGNTNQTSVAADGVTAVAVDPGLQLGTGTTDAIIGAYYFDNLSQNWDYFVQAQFQSALDSANMAAGAYRPGDSINLTGGLRFHGFDSFTPTVQLNARKVQTDSGTAADTFSTGGTLVYLTPGVAIAVTDKLEMHSDLQIPLYQNLNGIQLTPRYIVSIGARFSF